MLNKFKTNMTVLLLLVIGTLLGMPTTQVEAQVSGAVRVVCESGEPTGNRASATSFNVLCGGAVGSTISIVPSAIPGTTSLVSASCSGGPGTAEPTFTVRDTGSRVNVGCPDPRYTNLSVQVTEDVEMGGGGEPAPVEPAPGFDLDPGNDADLNTEALNIGCTEEGLEVGEVGADNNPIVCKFVQFVNFASIGVSIVATITVAIVGAQYMLSRGNPSKTAEAVGRLVKVGMGIVMYVFGWALLNWLIPGGVFT